MKSRIFGTLLLLASSSGLAAPPVSKGAAPESVVDLAKLDSQPQAKPSAGSPLAWKAYFDLLLINRPSVTDLSFANVHSFLFLDLLPNPAYRLSFDVNSSRGGFNFFQLDYQATPALQLSLGKIWIPFDDLDPHHIFGGRVGASDSSFIQPGQTSFFLPDLWAELGVGLKWVPVDSPALLATVQAYVVNGFQDGGTDPVTAGGSYPNFSGYGVTSRDNNRDKAVGGRLHALLGGKFGLGFSIYSGRWNDQGDADSRRILMLEADAQLRLSIAEIRAGGVQMETDLSSTSTYKRGGFYGELGITSRDNRWKLVIREGSVSLDNRVESVTDQTVVGGKLLYRPSFIQWSAEYSRDVQERPGKAGQSLAAIRAIIEI